MNRILASLLSVLALAGAARASALGIVATDAGFAYWETFASSTSYPVVTIADQAATSAAAADFTATLSAAMSGSTPGGGERIYSGTGATSNAFNLTLDVVADASVSALTLQLKFTGPLQNVAVEDNIAPAAAHFSVAADESWGDAVLSYLGHSTETAGTFYIYAWTWTGLDIAPAESFSLNITSAPGHVSLDAVRLDAAAIPEPSSFAALAGLAVLGCAALRRHRRA